MAAPTPVSSRPLRWFYISLGSVAVALGVLGIFIRGVLPTIPFLLLAAWCYSKGSPRLHTWLVNHPKLGPVLHHWWTDRSIPRSAKLPGILSVWIGIGIAVIFFVDWWVLQGILLCIALGVTIFLSTRKTWVGPKDPPAPLRVDAAGNRP